MRELQACAMNSISRTAAGAVEFDVESTRCFPVDSDRFSAWPVVLLSASFTEMSGRKILRDEPNCQTANRVCRAGRGARESMLAVPIAGPFHGSSVWIP